MEKFIIDRWDKNKKLLEKYFKETPQGNYSSYENIVKAIIDKVINPQEDEEETILTKKFSNNITVIDDGDYQGCQLFIIAQKIYQPSPTDYLITNTYYGSCSGCDTLIGIQNFEEGLPTEEQVSQYMTLSLHLIQKMKFIYSEEE